MTMPYLQCKLLREREKEVYRDPAYTRFFLLPSLQTAHDILHELCEMLGLQSEEDMEEFGLYADPGKRVSTLHSILYIIYIVHVRTSHRSIWLYATLYMIQKL